MAAKMETLITDRKLGHEWYGWDGNADTHEGFIEEPKRLFLGIVTFTFGIVFAAASLLVWGFYPRLQSIHPALATASVALLGAFAVGFLLWMGIMCFTLVTHKPSAAADRINMHFLKMFDYFAYVSERLGISRDRLGYSLIEIHNEITRMKMRATKGGRLLVLSPRCIDREHAEQIRTLSTEYDCDFYMAPTGAQARQKVAQTRPAAIIGIACERDLISGIRDVGEHFPVLGVTNKRPIGPCKGAFIDMEELKDGLEVFRSRYGVDGSAGGNETGITQEQEPELQSAAQ